MVTKPRLYPVECLGKDYYTVVKPTELPGVEPNVFRDALPIYERSDMWKRLVNKPKYVNDVDLPNERRIDLICINLSKFYFPLMHNVNYAANFYRTIRLGYENRNLEKRPYLLNEYKKIISDDLVPLWKNEIQSENIQPRYMYREYDYHQDPNNELFAGDDAFGHFGFHLIGQAGMGKTQTIQRVAKTFPQLLYHSVSEESFKDNLVNLNQLVWVVVSTPADGSMKNLCKKFISNVSGITKTDYYKYYKAGYSHTTTGDLMEYMARLSANLNLGVLVLDEIQYLANARGQNKTLILNYLNDLTNSLGIPIIMAGTYPALEFLAEEFRQMRRAIGQPQDDWHPLPYTSLAQKKASNDSWQKYLPELWRYQYTPKVLPLSEAWHKVMHTCSCGIIDIAQKIFQFAQIRTIYSGAEKITPNIVQSIYVDYFHDLDQTLDLIRNKKWEELAERSDYNKITVEKFIQLESTQAPYSISNSAEEDDEKVIEETTSSNVEEEIIENSNNITKDENDKASEFQILTDILAPLQEETQPQDDLRRIVEEGSKHGLTAEESLTDYGYIFTDLELLEA